MTLKKSVYFCEQQDCINFFFFKINKQKEDRREEMNNK